MNALANSQLEELEQVPRRRRRRTARDLRALHRPGGRTRSGGASLANPPDILLTNYMMLELLMTRQDERRSRSSATAQGLRFLVLDELHTYRGRQGADVAMLVRRVRERCRREKLQCIGTSATMASEGARGQEQGSSPRWPRSSSRPRSTLRTSSSRRSSDAPTRCSPPRRFRRLHRDRPHAHLPRRPLFRLQRLLADRASQPLPSGGRRRFRTVSSSVGVSSGASRASPLAKTSGTAFRRRCSTSGAASWRTPRTRRWSPG